MIFSSSSEVAFRPAILGVMGLPMMTGLRRNQYFFRETYTGTIGTPVRVANRAAPPLADTSSPSWTRVPSGNTSILPPAFRQVRASFTAFTSAWPRST